MGFQLRPYQVEVVRAGVEFLLDPRRKRGGLVVAPTGSGKSWMLAGIADALNAPLLVFQPNREILLQNKQKMESFGFRPSIYSASLGRRDVGADVVLATIGSVAARAGKKGRASKADLFADYPYIAVDECHLVGAKGGQYKSFFDEVDAKLIGFSATPFRLASNSFGSELRFLTRTRPKVFSEVVAWVQTGDLFEQGFLSPMEYYQIHGFDRSLVRMNSTGADYDDKSLQLHLFKIGFQDKVVEVMNRVLKAGRRNVLTFVRYVKDAEYIAAQVSGAVVVTSDTPDSEREAIGEDFKAGKIVAVVNCGVYLLGFDHPRLECVIDAAHSISLSRVYQKWGRGARPHPDKQSCWVVDMCGGYDLFGRIQDLRLYCEKESLWAVWGRPGGPDKPEVQLTNKLIGGGTGGVRCKTCQDPRVFWGRHEITNNSQLLCRPPEGTKPNIVLKKIGERTVYAMLRRDDPQEEWAKAEFIAHRAICPGKGAATQ